MDRNPFIGKISNGASQNIKAPNQIKSSKSGTVKTGTDLRTGK